MLQDADYTMVMGDDQTKENLGNQTAKVDRRFGRVPHPNSLANMSKPGMTNNPHGRKNHGASIVERLDAMADWTMAQVRAVIKDRKSTMVDVAAARRWMRIASDGISSAGVPTAFAELEASLDRSLGKSEQKLSINSTSVSMTAIEMELRGLPDESVQAVRQIFSEAQRRLASDQANTLDAQAIECTITDIIARDDVDVKPPLETLAVEGVPGKTGATPDTNS